MNETPLSPGSKLMDVTLSDDQWRSLVDCVPNHKASIDGAKQNLEKAISAYVRATLIDQHDVMPGDLSKPFIELERLSGALLLFIENTFFSADPNNQEFVFNEIRKIVDSRDTSEPLILEKSKERRAVASDKQAERNELIRRKILNYAEHISINHLFEELNMEDSRRSVYDLNVLAKTALKKMPSARGKHGDPYFYELIAAAYPVYFSLGGEDYYTADALTFMQLMMEYVVGFVRPKISKTRAGLLEPRTKGNALKEKIKEAREMKWLRE